MAPSADFSQSENKGLQMGQNYGNLEASFYSDSISGINIAAGASVYMGKQKKDGSPPDFRTKLTT